MASASNRRRRIWRPCRDGSPCSSGQPEPHSALYFDGTTWGVKGCIFAKYQSLGETSSGLGYPTSGEYGVSGGIRQDFQYGYILWANGVATPYFSGPPLTLRSAAKSRAEGVITVPMGTCSSPVSGISW